ncbi:MAG: PQQ-binding-like beta-propeller repeat protein [Cyanobacteria bacterium NC_groundwater_1444_Ag_S-0.65um_54_12]|nr:PQQ-binding-like beta-propeller repeat protein [Cyanobacteria bacterium NC_groundwater_1444_Ag_S-0.65um_54_12]
MPIEATEHNSCPICQRLNPADHRFCSGCGAKVQLPLPLGTVLDNRYRVIEVLSSEGGFATTYIVEDLQLFGRRQVLKELRPQLAEREQARVLFAQEARILAALGHPGIPRIQGFFSQDQRDYLVEDFIEGHNLGKLIAERGTFSEEETLRVLVSLLKTLEYLHGRTPPIVHRDIKPANLLLGESGQVILIDFGAVRMASRPGLLTVQDGMTTIVYTQGYAPPEQVLGHAVPASDLYALGATALHLLLGKNPQAYFEAKIGRHQVPGGLPPRLARVLDRLLEPVVSARYDHAGDVLRDLGYGINATLPVALPGSVKVAVPDVMPTVALGDYSGQERGRYVTGGPEPRGEVRWEVRLPAPLAQMPTLWQGTLLAVGQDRILYAIATSNGSISWARPIPGDGSVPNAPEAFGNRIVIQSQGLLTSFALANGDLAWTHPLLGLLSGQAPIVADDRVIVIDVIERRLLAFDTDGQELWSTAYGRKRLQADPEAILRLDGPALATCHGNTILLIFKQTATAFRVHDGALLWTQEQPFCQDHPPAAGRRIFSRPIVMGRRAYLYSSWDCLYCINLADGYLHWAHHTGSLPASPGPVPPPLVDDSSLYILPAGWKLFAYSLSERARRWSFSAGGRPILGTCLAGAQLYLTTGEGILYALERETGKLRWQHTAGEAFVNAPICGDGFVYAGTASGKLLALA